MHKPRGWFVASLVFLAFSTPLIASPFVTIQTYDQWTTEIGASGHVTPILSWQEGGFETLYPGEMAAFRIPTLSALANEGGKPALEMDFGLGVPGDIVIGGFTYTYAGDQDLTGTRIQFTVRKKKANDPDGEYSLHLSMGFKNPQKQYKAKIPDSSGAGDEWESVEIDPSSAANHEDKNFDLKKVKTIHVDYRGRFGDPGSPGFKGKIDSFKVVPDPSSPILVSFGAFALLLYRRYFLRKPG